MWIELFVKACAWLVSAFQPHVFAVLGAENVFVGVLSGAQKPSLKGIVHTKILILSFTHRQTVSNLFKFFSSIERRRIYFEECW